jgi:hypothetical protein
MNLRDRAIELGSKITALRIEIAELDIKRTQLSALEAELDSMLAPQAHTPHNGAGTIDERILEILQGLPDKQLSATVIHAGMDDVNIDSLRSALARMANEGKIRRPERGLYQAP